MATKRYSVTARDYGVGLDTTSGAENLVPGSLTVSENIRYNRVGGARTRLGFEEKANLSTSLKIDTITTMEGLDVMFLKSGTTIQQSVDGVTWYDIGVTRTAAEREFFHFIEKDMFATNVTDSFLRITVSSANGAIGDSDSTITVRTGDIGKFTTSGNIYIRGDVIAYTGKNSTQLTGVSGIISGGHPIGSIITQTSTPSGAPKGSSVSDFLGSTLVGGQSTAKNALYNSAQQNVDNPELSYDFSANGAGKKAMPSDITALHKSTSVVIIGMERGIDYVRGFELDTGKLLTSTITSSHGVPNAFCIINMDELFVVFTGKRVLLIANDRDGVRIVEDKEDPFDYPVRAFLDGSDEDQTLSFVHYDTRSRELHVSVLVSGVSKILIYNRDTGNWSLDTSRPFSSETNFKGRVYAGSDNDDRVYLVDELTTDDGIAILHRMVSHTYVLDDRRYSSDYLKFTFGGFLSGIGVFKFRVIVDGAQVAEEEIKAEDLISAGLMNLSTGIPLGSGTIGPHTIGSSGFTVDVYEFTYPYEMLYSGHMIQFEWEIFDEGTVFEIRDSRLDAETSETLELPNQ